MKRILLLAVCCSLFFCLAAQYPLCAAETDAQYAVVKKYIRAYFMHDMPTLRQCLPASRDALFIDYPFAKPPKLSTPKVHKTQALVEFSGTMLDRNFPTRGGIICYRRDNIWRVRTILFYDTVPPIFGLPSHSINDKDRAQEHTVAQVCTTFMTAWHGHDTNGMLAKWYDWPSSNAGKRDPNLSLGPVILKRSLRHGQDPFISYTVKATYHLGPIPISMDINGGLILVNDNNTWKVRANHFFFDFD